MATNANRQMHRTRVKTGARRTMPILYGGNHTILLCGRNSNGVSARKRSRSRGICATFHEDDRNTGYGSINLISRPRGHS